MRYEKWHNGHIRPTDWDGKGQPSKHETIKPDEWSLLLYLDDGKIELSRFDSKEKRDDYLKFRLAVSSRKDDGWSASKHFIE